jgi:hypothetical protein
MKNIEETDRKCQLGFRSPTLAVSASIGLKLRGFFAYNPAMMRNGNQMCWSRNRYRPVWSLILCAVAFTLGACSTPKPLPTEPDSGSTAAAKLPHIRNTIQVGAFSTSERAERYARRLQASGLDAFYMIDADGLYKVRFERFETIEAARGRAEVLRSRGIIGDYFIVTTEPAGSLEALNGRLRENLVHTAARFIGTPYRWGGASKKDGFDCSGLTMTVYRLNGLELPRSARDQFRVGQPVAKHSLEKGDLVFFATGRGKRISHVGIYSGQDQFIHAPRSGKTIRRSSLQNRYYKSRYMGARRYF